MELLNFSRRISGIRATTERVVRMNITLKLLQGDTHLASEDSQIQTQQEKSM